MNWQEYPSQRQVIELERLKMSATISIELERELWDLFRPYYQHPDQAIKEIAIMELYRRREISSGKAAEMLGMERFEFVRYASRMGISYFDMDESELKEEISRSKGTK